MSTSKDLDVFKVALDKLAIIEKLQREMQEIKDYHNTDFVKTVEEHKKLYRAVAELENQIETLRQEIKNLNIMLLDDDI